MFIRVKQHGKVLLLKPITEHVLIDLDEVYQMITQLLIEKKMDQGDYELEGLNDQLEVLGSITKIA